VATEDDDKGAAAGVPVRSGADSADVVFAESFSPRELKALLVLVPAFAAAVAGLAGVFLTLLMAAFSHPRWPVILTVVAVIFGGVVLWSVATTLTGIRRIEFRPARAPTHLRLVRLRGAEVFPIDRLTGITLRYPVAQSPDYPWTIGPTGTVDIRLDIVGEGFDDPPSMVGTITADVDVLAGHLGDLLAHTEVRVRREAEYPPLYDPDIVDDRLPAGGVVLRILGRRTRPGVPGRPAPGYLSDQEAGAAWDPVWHVPRTAAANKVRVKRRMAGSPTSHTWVEYRAVDVQRVADEIAAGTAVTEPAWRTDTGEGRAARAALAASRVRRRRRSR
jgi:hypothetical protein